MPTKAEYIIATAHSITDTKPHHLGLFDGDQDAADQLTETLKQMGFHVDWLETSPLQLTVTRKQGRDIYNITRSARFAPREGFVWARYRPAI